MNTKKERLKQIMSDLENTLYESHFYLYGSLRGIETEEDLYDFIVQNKCWIKQVIEFEEDDL